MNFELQIVSALILDVVLGDPRWLPHPVKFIGLLAGKTEKICRQAVLHAGIAGFCTVFIVLLVTGFLGWGLIRLAGIFHPLAGDVVSVLILYTCFAARDLLAHSGRVYDALQKNDLVEARQRVGMIVGRDTSELTREEVVRACVESVAENTVDGITAPLFWAAVGGPLGALLYKAINTMDSIFGYKNERYLRFGLVPARLDDLVNYLPARISGLLMVVAAFIVGTRGGGAWLIFCRDRHKHASPNAGQTESAVAGALGIQLGGDACYFGKMVQKPVIGDDLFCPEAVHIDKANLLTMVTTVLMAVFLVAGGIILRWLLCNHA